MLFDVRRQLQNVRLIDLPFVHRPRRPDRVAEGRSVRGVCGALPESTGGRQERGLGIGRRTDGVVEDDDSTTAVAVRRRKPNRFLTEPVISSNHLCRK